MSLKSDQLEILFGVYDSTWNDGTCRISSNEDSGEPLKMYRLTRTFAAHIHKNWI